MAASDPKAAFPKAGTPMTADAYHVHGPEDHAHSGNRDDTVSTLHAAEEACLAKGMRLTDLRRAVFEALVRSDRPRGAYDLIETLADQGMRRLAPISIYRALDFLREAGLVHKLESRNAFLACPHNHSNSDVVVFMICDQCGRVREATSAGVDHSLAALAAGHGFRTRGQVIELAGHCADCPPLTAAA